jgi:hypothetical protein
MPSMRQNLGTADLLPLFSGELPFDRQHVRFKRSAIPKSFNHDWTSGPFDLEDVILGRRIDAGFNLKRAGSASIEPDH